MSKLEEEFGVYNGFVYKERKPTNSLVEGIGINNSPFVVQPTIDGVQVKHPAYKCWQSMLGRCYSEKYKEKRPTYQDVTCCEEWLLFTNFAKWFSFNYKEGFQLDKDLLIKGNRQYSQNTCIFIPGTINNFLTISGNSRGSLPLGVHMSRGRYQASISIGTNSKTIGCFSDQVHAHQAWQKAKLEQAIAFNFQPLQRVIDQLTYEIENNLETISL